MDTAKAANLFTVYRDADLYDFINAPVGKGLPITQPLRPLIAIPVSHYDIYDLPMFRLLL